MTTPDTSDLLIIGAGLAGITAATAAVRQGYTVTLISAHDHHPPDFRGEKLGEAQMAVFDRIGLGPAARGQTTPFEGVWSYRFGRLAERSTTREYASDYTGLVNALGSALPSEITRITGRIASISTNPGTQSVSLNDGRSFTGRLLVVATGLSDAIRRMLGMERTTLSRGHSLSLGFDLAEPAGSFAFPSLCWGREPGDPTLSYLTLFPLGATMRGNLFVYRNVSDPWVRDFRQDPMAIMRQMMPRLEAQLGSLSIAGDVSVRPIDAGETTGHLRDGVVLLGDAFSTVCPITGLGMVKAINDADVLVHNHLHTWLATPGMASNKIAAFYADPAKTTLDARAMLETLVGRKHQLGETAYWRTRRLASITLRRVRDSIFADPGPLRDPRIEQGALAPARRIG